ncbi:hypothetical protein HWB92_gp119 [Serratia phage vB_SmaA_3M]|uniref:Uncharacterized protein n=1 Tax=Serratia phage vB_SmaA_3M TaxID=2419930 RepID=A0A3G2YS93_9CAUD|nr:hypothetical protein HWB92_gp119 [Serratia phage vB_SmaA_3M]AYP28377.1 hypothetical protein 3M_121 [Serratia phage vB_SmaA_3M]
MENQLTAFSKEEFACYPGATPFSNGDAPLVMYVSDDICAKISEAVSVSVDEVTLICSGESAELIWWEGGTIGAGRSWSGEQLSKNVAFVVSEMDADGLFLWLVSLISAK